MARGLKGLRRYEDLSDEEKTAYYNKNAETLKNYGTSLRAREKAAEHLYNNDAYISKYGIDSFNSTPYKERNARYKHDTINENFSLAFKSSLGANFNKYNRMSDDYKEKALKSGYMTDSEFEDDWNKNSWIHKIREGKKDFNWLFTIAKPLIDEAEEGVENGIKMYYKKRNDKILENIYNDNLKEVKNSQEVSDAIAKEKYRIAQDISDSETQKLFTTLITRNNKTGNLGIPTFQAFYGNGKSPQDEMKDFGIDDMRETIAKYNVLTKVMDPEDAYNALENDAKDYVTDRQGGLTQFGLWAKDTGISTLSYTFDKINGAQYGYLSILDRFMDKPEVNVDDKGRVLGTDVKFIRNNKGNLGYVDTDGIFRTVHKEKIDRATLFNMGKDSEGNDKENIWNQQYWTKAEQYGTLDEDEQKQLGNIGVSPHKVALHSNEETGLLYEGTKMMSFALADGVVSLIPFGLGKAGKLLSMAGKASKLLGAAGKGLQTAGEWGAMSKVSQIAQGTAGAVGIANAYQRGAFDETLSKNLMKAEEKLQKDSQVEVWNLYNTNADYKKAVDTDIALRKAQLWQTYQAQAQDSGMKIVNPKAIDEMLTAQARQEVLEGYTQQQFANNKNSQKFVDLQQEAINSAGNTALQIYATEGLKYALVNTMGFRKFLYTNPTGLSKKVGKNLKNLKEAETSAGKQRLTLAEDKFNTRSAKLKQFGKTFGKQVWGGAWTNGTDDMQVDMAENWNNDSYNNYLSNYGKAEKDAETYNLIDAFRSYVAGGIESLTQETTWNAAMVGGLGSVVSVAPHTANILSMATKSGRQAFNNNFGKEYVRDEKGFIKKDEAGNPIEKKVDWKDNWRDRVAYFIQNGVLQDYYGAKQEQKGIQGMADEANEVLDFYNDFDGIKDIVSSDIATDNAESLRDAKTLKFIKAINALNVLNNRGESPEDALTLSSVVAKAKDFAEKASALKDGTNNFTEEETEELLNQYFQANKSIPRDSEENRQEALKQIGANATELNEAVKALNDAQKFVDKVEKDSGEQYLPNTKAAMIQSKALKDHWSARVEKMKNEIGDHSVETRDEDISNIFLATLGSVDNARKLVDGYNKQIEELNADLKESKDIEKQHSKDIKDITKRLKKADNVNEKADLQTKLENANNALLAQKEQTKFLGDLITSSSTKKDRINKALSITSNLYEGDATQYGLEVENIKYAQGLITAEHHRKNDASKIDAKHKKAKANSDALTAQYQELSDKLEHLGGTVLSASDIFNLNHKDRARMMDPANRHLYSDKQVAEIEKLEAELNAKGNDALNKIQDIALLENRIRATEDAFSRMKANPTAAEASFEKQKTEMQKLTAELLQNKIADSVVSYIDLIDRYVPSDNPAIQAMSEIYLDQKIKALSTTSLERIEKTLKDRLKNLDLSSMDKETKYKSYLDSITEQKAIRNTVKGIFGIVEKTQLHDNDWKNNVVNAVSNIAKNASTHQDLLRGIEVFIDENSGEEESTALEEAMSMLEKEDALKRDYTTRDNLRKAKAKEAEKAIKRSDTAAVASAKATIDKVVEIEGEDKPSEEPAIQAHTEKPEGTTVEPSADKPADEVEETPEELPKTWEIALANEALSKDDKVTVDIEIDATLKQNVKKAQDKLQEDLTDAAKTLMSKEDKDSADNAEAPMNDDAKHSVDTLSRIIAEGIAQNESTSNIIKALKENEETKDTAEGNEDAIKEFIKDKREEYQANIEASITAKNTQTIVKDGVEYTAIDSASIEDELVLPGNTSNAVPVAHLDNNTTETSLSNNVKDNTLSGGGMSLYKGGDVLSEGYLIEQNGNKNDSMYQFRTWCKERGINLQDIRELEFPYMVAENPDIPIHFVAVNNKALKEGTFAVTRRLMLAVEATDAVLSNHDNNRGGIIVAKNAEGKDTKYLIVGDTAYATPNKDERDVMDSTKQLELWDTLFNQQDRAHSMIGKASIDFFSSNPSEQYYVSTVTTKVVPGSIISGFIVKHFEGEGRGNVYTDLRELVGGENKTFTNPTNLTFNNMMWGIQHGGKNPSFEIKIIGKDSKQTTYNDILKPQDAVANKGRVFIMIPTTNAKWMPAEVVVPKFSTLFSNFDSSKNSELTATTPLQQKVVEAVNNLIRGNSYDERLSGLKVLSNIFSLKTDKNTILLSKTTDSVALTYNGAKYAEIKLADKNQAMEKFVKAFAEMNPTIRITPYNIEDRSIMKLIDEGLIQLDIRTLRTIGGSYRIYGLDAQGNMIIPEGSYLSGNTVVPITKYAKDIVYSAEGTPNLYHYDMRTNQYFAKGEESTSITDQDIIRDLEVIRTKVNGNVNSLLTTSDGTNYYTIRDGEHPLIVSISNTGKVKWLSEEKSKQVIDTHNKKEQAKARAENAKKALENAEYLHELVGLFGNGNTSNDNATVDKEETTQTLESFDKPKSVTIDNTALTELGFNFDKPTAEEISNEKPSIQEESMSSSEKDEVKQSSENKEVAPTASAIDLTEGNKNTTILKYAGDIEISKILKKVSKKNNINSFEKLQQLLKDKGCFYLTSDDLKVWKDKLVCAGLL